MRGLRAVLSISLVVCAGLMAQNRARTGSLDTPLPSGQSQNSGTDVQLRGISAVSAKVAWASGAKGTVLRTVDGGDHWVTLNVPGVEALDFRDIQAFDQDTAFVLSIGPGDQSRIYKTADGGRIWQL
ncbi:MAG TPA: oxidoreductase, partial [Candidatus Angelobacter sp.]|nr:oxidoreductase [Candidatus Angelobacter sp.]